MKLNEAKNGPQTVNMGLGLGPMAWPGGGLKVTFNWI